MMPRIFKKSTIYFSGLILSKTLSLLVFILFARALLPSSFGQFVFFLTLLQVVTFFSDFGLNQWYQKEKGKVRTVNIFKKVVLARLITLLVSTFVMSLFLIFIPQFNLNLSTIFLYALIPEAFLSIIDGYYLEKGESYRIALKTAGKSAIMLGGFFIFKQYFSVETAINLYFLSSFSMALLLFPWRFTISHDKVTFRDVIKTLKSSSGYALLIFTSFFYARADHFAVKYLISDAGLGLYNGAYRYLETLALAPTALFQNLFPEAAKGGIKRESLKKIIKVMMIVGFLFSCITFVFADFLIITILGQEYNQAVPILKILSVVLFLFFVNAPLSAVIQSSNLLGKFLPWGVSNTLFNIILNIIFIIRFGINGAAYAMLFTEVTGLIINLYFINLIYQKKN